MAEGQDQRERDPKKAEITAYEEGWKGTFDRAIKTAEEAGNKDDLTGLLNRKAVREKLKQEIIRCQRTGDHLTIALVDLDRLKRINDDKNGGHAAGDAALKDLAGLLTSTFRKDFDYVGRWGGDEFLAVFPETTTGLIIEKIDDMRQTFADKSQSFKGTISIGIAQLDPDFLGTKPVDDLVSWADKALYASKKNGRNKVSFFDNGKIISLKSKATAALPSQSPAKSG